MEQTLEDKRKSSVRKRSRSTSTNDNETSFALSEGTIQRARSQPSQLDSHEILTLQRTMGNRSVQRLLSPQVSVPTHTTQPLIQRAPEDEEDQTQVDSSQEEHHLGEEDLQTTESPGFKLLDDAPSEGEFHLGEEDLHSQEPQGFELLDNTPKDKAPAAKKSASEEYHERRRAREEMLKAREKPKQTFGQKLKRYGKMGKQFVKNQTVNSYGKIGIHAIMNQDERTLRKAARMIKKDPQGARALLRYGVHRVIKEDFSSVKKMGTRIKMVLMMPVWLTRWSIAHRQWRSLAKQVGLIESKRKLHEKAPELPAPKQPESAPWQGAKPQIKDTYGEMHAYMLGVGQNTHKGKGMTDPQKLRVWDKWRSREMDNPSIQLGQQRHSGWTHAFSRSENRHLGKKDPTLGKHRPVWGFRKPINVPKPEDARLGKHRPVWGFNKPSGTPNRREGIELGQHRPVWGFNKPTSVPQNKVGIGSNAYRRHWRFNKPSGDQSKLKVGLRGPVWNPRNGKGPRGNNLGMGSYRRHWRFNKPGGEQSGLRVGLRGPVWNPTEPSIEQQSRHKLGKARLPKPKWGNAKMPNFLQLPPRGSEMGSQRNPNLLHLDEPFDEMPDVGGLSFEPLDGTVTQGNEGEQHEPVTQSDPLPSSTGQVAKNPPVVLEERGKYPLATPLHFSNHYNQELVSLRPGEVVALKHVNEPEILVDGGNSRVAYLPQTVVRAALGMSY